MLTKNEQKRAVSFVCDYCDYNTSKQSNYNRHLLTPKHYKATIDLQKGAKKSKNEQYLGIDELNNNKLKQQFICICGNNYSHRQSLYKHQKICNKNENNIITATEKNNNTEIKTLTELVIEVVKNNNEFQKQIVDLIKNTNNININNCNNNNNNNNQTFNLQLFLNETCKDAMNMSDFINSFNLQVNDLERLADDGYVKTMSSLIINKVRELDVEKRPIHCTDAKREMVYIKEDDVWIKDDENKSHMRKAINKIGIKNISLLQDWQYSHPNCYKANSPYNDTYLKMMSQVMGGSDTTGNENKVIKNIIKEVVIDKQQYII